MSPLGRLTVNTNSAHVFEHLWFLPNDMLESGAAEFTGDDSMGQNQERKCTGL